MRRQTYASSTIGSPMDVTTIDSPFGVAAARRTPLPPAAAADAHSSDFGYHHFDTAQPSSFASQPLSSPSSIPSAAAAESASASSRSRSRKHRIFARLNSLECLLVQLLQLIHLWPAMMQPPNTDTLTKEIECTHRALVNGSSSEVGSGVRWTTALLQDASRFIYPNAWMPLSFRKTVIIEPSLSPLPPAASTHAQTKCAIAIIVVMLALNAIWIA